MFIISWYFIIDPQITQLEINKQTIKNDLFNVFEASFINTNRANRSVPTEINIWKEINKLSEDIIRSNYYTGKFFLQGLDFMNI